MGYENNDPRRCKSGINYTLSELADEGHVYAKEEQLIKSAKELLQADEEPIRSAMAEMVRTEELKTDGDAIYLPPFYYAEVGTANRLLALPQLFAVVAQLCKVDVQSGQHHSTSRSCFSRAMAASL